MVKGELRKESTGEFKKYVGFGLIQVVAINPSREELNKLFETDGEKTDELVYLTEDNEGNKKLKLTFIIKEENTGKLFYHNINLINKEKVSKTGNPQWINSALETTHVDGEANLPLWFKHFLDKEKNVTGDKSYKKAIIGEEALANFIRGWHGGLDFYKPTAEILIDRTKLFRENYRELKEMMDNGFTKPFVALFGVSTSAANPDKQYNNIYSDMFLPGNFMLYVNNGMNFPAGWAANQYKKLVDKAESEYGFSSYYELCAITEYSQDKDIAAQGKMRKEPTPAGSDFD